MAQSSQFEPVTMAERQLGPATPIAGGRVTEITLDGRKATLFVPDGFQSQSRVRLWCHFHSAPWFVVSEYKRAQCGDPVLMFDLGQGSAVYGQAFQNGKSLQPWIDEAAKAIGTASDPANVAEIGLTSFSAGFGAVREIVQDPHILRIVRSVVLCDSLYASLVPGLEKRTVEPAHVSVWRPLADRALQNDCRWICTTSQITPEAYAGTWEVALALVESTGNTMANVPERSSPASSDPAQPLIRRFDKGGLHVWSYAGDTAEAHMTHARRLAESIALVTGSTVTGPGEAACAPQ